MPSSATVLILLIATMSLYAGAFGHMLIQLLARRSPRHLAVMSLLLFALILHGVLLLPQLATPVGLNLNVFNVLSLTGWLMLGFSLLFSSYRPVLPLNLLAIPFAGLGLLLGTLLHAPYHSMAHLSTGLEAHIFLSLVAYCLLFMAAVQSVLVSIQHRELKHRSQTRIWVQVLPPLQTMESLLYDMLLIGFGLLTLALGLGLFAIDNLFAQHLAHKTFFSALSWLVFAGLLIGHWRFGWRGQRAVRFTLTGFGLLALGFVGSKLVLELILGRAG